MSMGSSGNGKAAAEINVTPLIDVLLVLLIVFVVIVPVVPKGLEALAPQPPRTPSAVDSPRTIVLQVSANDNGLPSYKINEETISKSAIEARLQAIFSTRQERVLFVKGDPNVLYASVAEVIDLGHQAGVDNIGILTPNAEAGR